MIPNTLQRDFSNGVMADAAVVEQASKLLLAHYGLTERFGWIAIKDQIEIAVAQRIYPGKTKGAVAIHWLEQANNGTLHVQFNAHGSLVIRG